MSEAPEADAGTDAGEADDSAVGEPADQTWHDVPVSTVGRMRVLHPRREQLVELVRALRDTDDFIMCLDVSGVDYLTYSAPRPLPEGVEPERFEVVVHLISHATSERVRLKVQVPESDPVCPSLFDVHPGTEAMERETYDMFGILFEGHPDLTRILMPEDWEGHPLRKDYGTSAIPVQFKAEPSRSPATEAAAGRAPRASSPSHRETC